MAGSAQSTVLADIPWLLEYCTCLNVLRVNAGVYGLIAHDCTSCGSRYVRTGPRVEDWKLEMSEPQRFHRGDMVTTEVGALAGRTGYIGRVQPRQGRWMYHVAWQALDHPLQKATSVFVADSLVLLYRDEDELARRRYSRGGG